MADFSKFKIGNTSYNVKDAAAGKSLSISGTDLSLKNAAGTAISTVTIPAGSKYAILTLSNVGSDIVCTYVDSSEASMGTASALIDLIKAGGVAYVNYGGSIYNINNCLDGSVPGVSGYELKAESDGYGYSVSDVSDFSLVNSVWTAITPGGGSYTPNMICGITTQNGNLGSFDITGYRPISIVEGNASFMVRVALIGTYPTEYVDCIPAGVKIKDGNNTCFASWEGFNSAHPSGGTVYLDLYLVGLLSNGGIVKISSISGDVGNGIIDYLNGNSATVSSVQYIGA